MTNNVSRHPVVAVGGTRHRRRGRLLRLVLAGCCLYPVLAWPADDLTGLLRHGADVALDRAGHRFSEQEKGVLRDFLRGGHGEYTGQHDGRHDRDRHEAHAKKPKKQKALPPGLRKKLERGGELPPGWQRKVARGEVLDYDLYGASRPLPRDWLDRLPRGPEGTSIRRLDDRVVRIIDATRVILDVFLAP